VRFDLVRCTAISHCSRYYVGTGSVGSSSKMKNKKFSTCNDRQAGSKLYNTVENILVQGVQQPEYVPAAIAGLLQCKTDEDRRCHLD